MSEVEWQPGLLREIAQPVTDKWVPSSIDTNIPYVGLEHISPENPRIGAYGKSSDVISTKNQFKAGDTLFGKLRPYLKKVAHADLSGVCSTDIIPIRANQKADPSYLYYLLSSPKVIAKAVESSAGNVMPRASWSDLADIAIEIPPLPEQKKIAEILSGIDRLLNVATKKIQKLSTARSRVAEDILLSDNSARVAIQLSDCVELIRGYAFKSEDYREKGGIRILRVTNIKEDGQIDLSSNCVRISEDARDQYRRHEVMEDDLLLVMVGATTGKLGVVSKSETPSLLNQNIWCLRSSSPSTLLQKYLRYSMPKVVSLHLEKQQGSARDFLTQKEFFKESIEIPDIALQKKVVKAISQIETSISKAKKLREKVLMLKSSLSADLLSGRKRVSV
jgi:type I restriction enzyme S subunit